MYQDDLHRLAHFRDLGIHMVVQTIKEFGMYLKLLLKKGTKITDFLKTKKMYFLGCYEAFGRRFGRFRQFFGLF